MKFIQFVAIMTHKASLRLRFHKAIGYSIGWLVSKLPIDSRGYAEDYLMLDNHRRQEESLGETKFVGSKIVSLYGDSRKPRGLVNVSLRVRHRDEVLLDREALRELAKSAVDRITEKEITAA